MRHSPGVTIAPVSLSKNSTTILVKRSDKEISSLIATILSKF